MANYSYTAVTYDNTITSGMLTAKNPKEALEIVLARFAYPVRIHKTVPRALEFLYKDAGMTKMKASDTAGFMISSLLRMQPLLWRQSITVLR